MRVASFESAFARIDSETLVASSSAGVETSSRYDWDVECSPGFHAVLFPRLDSSSEVRSCGSCRLDKFDVVFPSGMIVQEVAAGKQNRRNGGSAESGSWSLADAEKCDVE